MTRRWRPRDARNAPGTEWLAEQLAAAVSRSCDCGHGRMAHAVDGPCDHSAECGCQVFYRRDKIGEIAGGEEVSE